MTYRIGSCNLESLFAPENFAQREPRIASAMRSDLRGWDGYSDHFPVSVKVADG